MSLINYNYPLRQAAGVLTTYLASVDGTFSITPSISMTGLSIGYIDPYTGDIGSSDLYTQGTYILDIQTLSRNDDIYFDTDSSIIYNLPSWISGSIQVVIGPTPSINGYQSISASIINISNNVGLTNLNFYLSLSETSIPSIQYGDGDGVYLLFNTKQGTTYQINKYSKNFYQFNQRLEQSSYLETDIYGENGSYGVNQKLEITLEGYDQKTKNIISVLNKSRLRAIIEDQSGNFYLIGYQNYITSTTSDGGLGKTYGDGVKTTLTFEGKESVKAISLDNSILYSGILIY